VNKRWLVILVVVLLLAAVFYFRPAASQQRRVRGFDKAVHRLLKGYEISGKESIVFKEYLVQKPLDIEGLKKELEELARRRRLDILKYETSYQAGEYSCIFEIGTKEKVFYILKIKGTKPAAKVYPEAKRPLAEVAIVIDDWGYNMNNIKLLESIQIPLTISILPSLPHSTDIARSQHYYKNREIILHMPLEPEDETVRLEENTILTSMDKKEVLSLLSISLKTVPYAKGLSSHMGSKATQDRKLMGYIMEELKRKDLYFLDSLATPDSVCKDEAKRLRLRFLQRNIFLDNKNDKAYISSQIDKLVRLAREKGSAVGIGHDRRLTLEAIKERSSQLEYDDIKFVFASQLAKN
jgi:polysaccharide deacetylase 2 family uncharacterized protein YibQ